MSGRRLLHRVTSGLMLVHKQLCHFQKLAVLTSIEINALLLASPLCSCCVGEGNTFHDSFSQHLFLT